MSEFSKTRLLGLDIVRAAAILMVLLSHGRATMPDPVSLSFLTFGGKFGVELFFVLSGFLIGTILLKHCDKGLSPSRIGNFWMRRWFRTLPAYFAVLLFIWLVMGQFDLLYFLSLQGIVGDGFELLPISWSLAIEEWFYLTFPLVCLVMLALAPKRGFLLAALLLLIAPLVHQLMEYGVCAESENVFSCFNDTVRKSSFRFTNIAMGALLAYAHVRHDLKALLTPRLKGFGLLTTIVFIATIAFTLHVISAPEGAFKLNLFYPLIGISSTLLVALFYVWEPQLPKWAVHAITFISLTSYSNYLWHMFVLQALKEWIDGWEGIGFFVFFIAASVAASGVSYVLTERPFMRLRDRITRHINKPYG